MLAPIQFIDKEIGCERSGNLHNYEVAGDLEIHTHNVYNLMERPVTYMNNEYCVVMLVLSMIWYKQSAGGI